MYDRARLGNAASASRAAPRRRPASSMSSRKSGHGGRPRVEGDLDLAAPLGDEGVPRGKRQLSAQVNVKSGRSR